MYRPNDVVRFTKDSRHGDWQRGALGTVTGLLARQPCNQHALYVVKLHDSGKEVWIYEDDVREHNQLSLF